MVDANIPDIALEPDKTVKKVCLLVLGPFDQCLFTVIVLNTWSGKTRLLTLSLPGVLSGAG